MVNYTSKQLDLNVVPHRFLFLCQQSYVPIPEFPFLEFGFAFSNRSLFTAQPPSYYYANRYEFLMVRFVSLPLVVYDGGVSSSFQ